MVNYQYTYLIWAFILFLVWLALYLWRKDTRKEMLIMSLLFGLAGPLSQIIYTQDWWQPLTITQTKFGIEDFIIGFVIGGIAAVVYGLVCNKKVMTKKVKKVKEMKRNINFLTLITLFVLLLVGSFYILKLNSAYSTLIAVIIPLALILIKRKDLWINSLLSGVLLLIIGIFIYFILDLIQPGFIQRFWYLPHTWYSILIFKIPLAEYIWYFLFGAFIGPLYEYWKEGKLINIKS